MYEVQDDIHKEDHILFDATKFLRKIKTYDSSIQIIASTLGTNITAITSLGLFVIGKVLFNMNG